MNITSVTLENLDPGTSYNVSVSAASDAFLNGGKQSTIVSFTTNTDGMCIIHYVLSYVPLKDLKISIQTLKELNFIISNETRFTFFNVSLAFYCRA